MAEHKEVCLKINDKQTAKLKSGSIKSKKHCKKLAVPFKIHADFECNVKKVKCSDKSSDRGDNTSYTKKYPDHVPSSFAYKVVCAGDNLSKPIVLYRGENIVYKFIDTILKEYDYCKKVIKKNFNTTLVMSAEDEKRFQRSNVLGMCQIIWCRAW